MSRVVAACVWSFAALVTSACAADSGEDAGSGYTGPNGCSKAPDCGSCGACFDSCMCQTQDADGCLAQCTGGGGAAGAGATGGTGPTGGAGGGTGATGATGATGGSGGGGGVDCTQLTTQNPNCDACIHASCCAAVETCLINSACVGLNDCLYQNCASAPDVNACANSYCSQYAAGSDAFNGMMQCIGSSCSAQCG